MQAANFLLLRKLKLHILKNTILTPHISKGVTF
jgi:hypothetical protein